MSAIEIPPERVAPFAQKVAKRSKDISAWIGAGWVVCVAGSFALLAGDLRSLWSWNARGSESETSGAFMLVVTFGLVAVALVGNWFVRRGRRADAVAALATRNMVKFAVDGDKLVAIDGGNILPPLTLSVPRSSRDELMGPPSARVVVTD